MSKMFEPTRTYKPFAYPHAVNVTVEHERMHWHEGELDLSDDVSDWKLGRLTPEERGFVTQILRMFTQADLNVGGFYLDNLMPVFLNNEIRNMLSSFVTREGTHQRAYALLNDTLGLPEADFAKFLEIKEMHDKDEFMRDAKNSSDEEIALALAKTTMNEGVSLFASFVMLLNFQRRGLMKGMGKVVEWSVKDETKHVEGVTWLFRQLCAERPEIVTDAFKKRIYSMMRECVELEDRFIDLAFSTGGILGIEPEEIKQYIRYIADRRLIMLGLKGNFKVKKNPLGWVDIILNAPDHTNFFENKVAEYEVGSLDGDWEYSTAAIRVYGRDNCEYCHEAKVLLTAHNIEFEYVDLSDVPARQAFYDARGFQDVDGNIQRTVPKVYHIAGDREELIGGYNALKARLESGTL